MAVKLGTILKQTTKQIQQARLRQSEIDRTKRWRKMEIEEAKSLRRFGSKLRAALVKAKSIAGQGGNEVIVSVIEPPSGADNMARKFADKHGLEIEIESHYYDYEPEGEGYNARDAYRETIYTFSW